MAKKAASPDTVIAHWSTLIENLQASPRGFSEISQACAHPWLPHTDNARGDRGESNARC